MADEVGRRAANGRRQSGKDRPVKTRPMCRRSIPSRPERRAYLHLYQSLSILVNNFFFFCKLKNKRESSFNKIT